jgi:hypothetical protein
VKFTTAKQSNLESEREYYKNSELWQLDHPIGIGSASPRRPMAGWRLSKLNKSTVDVSCRYNYIAPILTAGIRPLPCRPEIEW